MNYKLFRWVGTVWTVVLFMAVAASELHAIDSKGRSFAYGVGQKTCEDYVKFREKRLETLEKHERYTKDELYEIVDKSSSIGSPVFSRRTTSTWRIPMMSPASRAWTIWKRGSRRAAGATRNNFSPRP